MTGEPEGERHPESSCDSFDALLQRAAEGDSESAGLLVERYRKYLLLIANDRLDHRLNEKVGASDIVQESIVLAHANIDQFRGKSEQEFKAWLRQILINGVRKTRQKFNTRKRQSDRERHYQQHSSIGLQLIDQHLTPQSDLVRKEREALVQKALDRLSPDQKQVIVFRNFEDRRFEEIGELMDRSPDAARKLWARAILALKSALNEISPDSLRVQRTDPRDE